MATQLSPLAGKPASPSALIDVARLVSAYYAEVPDPAIPTQRVAFGTSGHRGSSFDRAFNEWHVLAITQAICRYRTVNGVTGPLFLGIDTHALSAPAYVSVLEVLAGNHVDVMLAIDDEYTPTPAISHAILQYNLGRSSGLADGIVLTPSHNPPRDGGFKYNPTNGGPASSEVTGWIEATANGLLEAQLDSVRRICHAKALRAPTTHRHDFLNTYVGDLCHVIDMDAIRAAAVRMLVDPLGGAGVDYWRAIADHYRIDLKILSEEVDQTFRFMTLDWDGQIRMDPSSTYAMQRLLSTNTSFDIAFACDTDHDRHGIVTPGAGLLPANHYQAVAVDYLFRHRQQWPKHIAIGKTVVGSQMIDRVAAKLGREVFEVPVGFKWYADRLGDGSLGFAGEESAGATFLRRDGSVWTTDKDGIVPSLLSAEITARESRDPGEIYRELTYQFGECFGDRIEAPATPEQKHALSKLSLRQVTSTELAGEKILQILSHAPGNGAPIGGLKVVAEHGWFAARPSGTENIVKIYVESFRDQQHLQQIADEAQAMIDKTLADAAGKSNE